MLIDFFVHNFKSIQNKSLMDAEKDGSCKLMQNRMVMVNEGQSDFVDALVFLTELMTCTKGAMDLPAGTEDEPTILKLSFRHKGRKYHYKVVLKKVAVHSEELFFLTPDGQRQQVLEREVRKETLTGSYTPSLTQYEYYISYDVSFQERPKPTPGEPSFISTSAKQSAQFGKRANATTQTALFVGTGSYAGIYMPEIDDPCEWFTTNLHFLTVINNPHLRLKQL